MKKKVAKLVTTTLITRVIVDKNATEDQIVKAAKPNYIAKLNNNELGENIEKVVDDKECPFGSLPKDFYYQPDMMSEKYRTLINKKRSPHLFSWQVFKSKALAQKAYPGVEVLEFSGDDIEEITFVDKNYDKKTGKVKKGLAVQ